jgi:hypothetical protein
VKFQRIVLVYGTGKDVQKASLQRVSGIEHAGIER